MSRTALVTWNRGSPPKLGPSDAQPCMGGVLGTQPNHTSQVGSKAVTTSLSRVPRDESRQPRQELLRGKLRFLDSRKMGSRISSGSCSMREPPGRLATARRRFRSLLELVPLSLSCDLLGSGQAVGRVRFLASSAGRQEHNQADQHTALQPLLG